MLGADDVLASRPSFDIVSKRQRIERGCHIHAGAIAGDVSARAEAALRAATGLWKRDPSVWTRDRAVAQTIANRLGWLDSPQLMAASLDRLRLFADHVRQDGFTDVVLLGMGGSSLAPEVLRTVVGQAQGYPRFLMLDSTDPAAVLAVSAPVKHTLFILASKSGGTIEPNSLAAYFRSRLEDARVPRWADHFVAITDEGTALADRARVEHFRDVFINPSDIGGRYSALSFFGLVPAALMGQDLDAIVGWGLAMLASADPAAGDLATNPAVSLGLAIGAAARAGRDKLTVLLPPALAPFGLWIEQLIAESTGKQGVGIVPIVGEDAPVRDRERVARPSLQALQVYGEDRVFVQLGGTQGFGDLESGGAPTISIDFPEPAALGAEFVRWEVATAIAGALLEINPFDEPNVQQAKDATRALLDTYKEERRLPMPEPDLKLANGVTLALSTAARQALGTRAAQQFLQLAGPNLYVALLAFVAPGERFDAALHACRMAIRDKTRAATMVGYGPRYLHSTGQLHKGGPNTGIFVVVTATPEHDVAIPGEPFTFGTLELAQGLGDFASLDATGRRALHVHLPTPDPDLFLKSVL